MREHIRARFRALGDDAREALGSRVAERVLKLPEYRDAGTLALFAATPKELPTRPLLEAAVRDGRRCLIPRVQPERCLDFAVVRCWENLLPGRYGLLEPGDDCESVPIAAADLLFVPGMAFDARGGRLGRGEGYYDFALGGLATAGQRAPVFGLAHDWQVLDAVPIGEQDVPVDGIVTEKRVLRVVGSAASDSRDERS